MKPFQKSRNRDYQRRYLRAPFKKEILFEDENFVFKGTCINISEGGLLLDQVGHFPKDHAVNFMAEIPEFPLFKNFSSEKLLTFSSDDVRSRVIRFKAKLVRTAKVTTNVDGMLVSKIGLAVEEMKPNDQLKISRYVESFSSNLVYLQVLIDSLTSDENLLSKIRLISSYLGYDKDIKIALLRKTVEEDYQSLQWL